MSSPSAAASPAAPAAHSAQHVLTLPECIDVLAAHPQHPTLLAVCTYMLHASGAKTGSIGLLRHAASAPRLALACPPLATAAVFDGHWGSSSSDCADSPLFLAATQGPALCLHALQQPSGEASLRALGAWRLPCASGGGEGSALSCAWLPGSGGSASARALASLADGRLWVGALAREGSGGGGGGGEAQQEACWAAHSLRGVPMEVWCAQPVAGGCVWSGGDDGLLKGWDARAAPSEASHAPAFVARGHGAGVTCIAPRPGSSGGGALVATGSYDGSLRLWDSRAMAAPLAALPLGGGVWRVQWQGSGASGRLAAACMHGGARVVQVAHAAAGAAGAGEGALAQPRVLASYLGHEAAALTYGVEWLEGGAGGSGSGSGDGSGGGAQTFALASCAFYSKEVHAWEVTV